jgi:DNA-directed RNA polymerase subunit K/omega
VTYLTSDRNAFEFVILASLRTKQLMAGCLPRVAPGQKLTSTAAMEVLSGKVLRLVDLAAPGVHPVRHR